MKIRYFQILVPIVLILILGACEQDEKNEPEIIEPAPIILISMDGFRWDYMNRTDTPNMDFIANEGVQAESMIPVFPSFTFPNHLSIVTGCYPQNHGIINNTMWDSVFEEWYFIGEGAEP
ncbi:alkaline phosphatase family protein, partial [bacterium]|nr:alkaline phosphatase family protein [bacterium]